MKFKLFDLTFNSEVDLASQKKIASNSTDVRIFFSKSYLPANYKSKNFEINEGNGFYFRKKVGLFEVSNGKEIKITPFTNVQNDDIENALLNFPIALCLSQRGKFVMHASSVKLNDNTLLFSGPSHSGKSTLASYLYSRGGELISEDISVISLAESAEIHTFCPFVKLSKEAAFIAKLEEQTYLFGNERGGYPVKPHKKNQSRIDKCFFIQPSNCNRIKELSNEHALRKVFKYSYISGSTDDQVKIFKFISKVKFYDLEYKKNFDEIPKIHEMIRRLLD